MIYIQSTCCHFHLKSLCKILWFNISAPKYFNGWKQSQAFLYPCHSASSSQLSLSYSCWLFFRTWWGEPARRRVCKWQTPSRCGTTTNSRACPSRGSTLWHLKAAAGQPRMRQQDIGQVRSRHTFTVQKIFTSVPTCGTIWGLMGKKMCILSTKLIFYSIEHCCLIFVLQFLMREILLTKLRMLYVT